MKPTAVFKALSRRKLFLESRIEDHGNNFDRAEYGALMDVLRCWDGVRDILLNKENLRAENLRLKTECGKLKVENEQLRVAFRLENAYAESSEIKEPHTGRVDIPE